MSDLLRDPLDFATQLSESERAHNEHEVRKRAQPKQVKGPDGTWPDPYCEDCGEHIGEDRLEATGATLCVGCATLREKKGRQYAKR